jgi:hypothetical protein
VDFGDDIPKFCPSSFCSLSVGSEGYNLLIPTTISVNTIAEVLDGNNVLTNILVRIVFPVRLRGPKPVWAQTYENRAPTFLVVQLNLTRVSTP